MTCEPKKLAYYAHKCDKIRFVAERITNDRITTDIPIPELTEAGFDCLVHLRWLRDAFSGRIPRKIVHSNTPGARYLKVRVNWFVGVGAGLSLAKEDGLITDPHVIQFVDTYLDDYCNHRIPHEHRTTRSDIRRADAIIGLVLGEFTIEEYLSQLPKDKIAKLPSK